jgi:hypothetical protein
MAFAFHRLDRPSVREDQRAAKADMALIVSHALPKGLQTFDPIDGVWVTEPRCADAVHRLGRVIDRAAAARLAGEGRQTKTEVVQQYLTNPRFRHRVEAVVERFSDMQAARRWPRPARNRRT